MGAAAGTQGVRDGKGEEAGRPWELLVERLVEPLPRLRVLTLWTMTMAAGMREAVLVATALAGREAGAGGTGAAGAEGLQSCEVCKRQGGGACEVRCAIVGADCGESGHDGTPGMTVLLRWTASACPL